MRYLTFSEVEKSTYKICILVTHIRKDEIEKAYITPFNLNKDDIIVIDLHQAEGKKKTPAKEMKEYIESELQEVLTDLGVEYVLVTDGEYFKVLTKSAQADKMLGYALPSSYGSWSTFYVPNYRAIFYDPEKVRGRIAIGVSALLDHMGNNYSDPGIDIIKYVDYPDTVEDIRKWLLKLLEMDVPLTCDIEAFHLKHHKAGLGSICFAWSQTEGIAFAIDFHSKEDALEIRAMLREFFEAFNNRLIYHSIHFDVTVLIYQLFMEHIIDTEGLLYGLEVMLKHWDCTRLITYLATNSCSGNKLGLKDQAQEYSGNYAVDNIVDITKIPLPELLQYNLVDGLSTWYVYNKHWNTVVNDNQLDIYNNIFKPAIIDIVQMQLTGMPLNMERVIEVQAILQKDCDDALSRINSSPLVQNYTHHLREQIVIAKNAKYVKKRITVADVDDEFNPNSGPQLIDLLYDQLGLPIIDRTDSKLPATGAKTLKSLKNHTDRQEIKDLLDALIDYKDVYKILTSFIPAMLDAAEGPDGWHYLFGSFNLGGTISGRLSSSDPNLQNLPANSRYAKLIKSCFQAPPGWHFGGIDFSSLEDRISALTTKDPEKLKVYIDGFDGHCLRALAYFGEEMTGIDPTSVESVNSIQTKYKNLRQDSKVPTFSLTYAGTYVTIMNSQGWSKEKAQKVEKAYHDLYKVSDQWVSDKLDEASRTGFVTVAFGLRLRTPLLAQVIRGTRKTPFEAEAEGRSAGNALGQSWCLLNSRAGSEFMGKVRKSEYRYDIRPCAQIHDAQYYLFRDDINVLMYVNEHVVEACEWQDHPDIWHDEVKLGGEFSVFYPDWSKEMEIPNKASAAEITAVIEEHMNKVMKNG